MSKLRLGPVPRNDVVRLTISLPAQVKADLDRYGEIYRAAYGESVDIGTLAAQMVAAFMERDRAFRRARKDPPETPTGSRHLVPGRTQP